MEYIMEKCLTPATTEAAPTGHFSFLRGPEDSDGIYECTVCEISDLNSDSHDNTPVSSFRILPYTKTPTAYFFDWKVYDPGHGIGSRLFPEILSYLASDYDRIKLQVSSDNTAAMKIYTSNGLEITESVY